MKDKKGRYMDWENTVLVLFFIYNSMLDIKNRTISLGSCIFMGIIGSGILLDTIQSHFITTLLFRCMPGIFLMAAGYKGIVQIGGGDGLVVLVIGIFQGVIKTMQILLVGLFVSALWGICLVIARKAKRNTEIPFVPFLFLGYLCCFLT